MSKTSFQKSRTSEDDERNDQYIGAETVESTHENHHDDHNQSSISIPEDKLSQLDNVDSGHQSSTSSDFRGDIYWTKDEQYNDEENEVNPIAHSSNSEIVPKTKSSVTVRNQIRPTTVTIHQA